MRVRRRGVTIVEMLITMAIVGMTGGIVISLLVSAKSMVQASASRIGVTQDLQTATARLVSELRDSNVQLVTAGATSAFAFLSARDAQGRFVTDEAGHPVWQKVVVYQLAGDRLLRREVVGAFTEALTPTALAGYCDGRGRLCAAGVTSVNLVPDRADGSAVFSVRCAITNVNGREDRQSRSVTVYMRN